MIKVQTGIKELQPWTAVSISLGLVSTVKLLMMVMTSDETQIQTFSDWPMSHAKRVTKDNRKNAEYHVVAAVKKLYWTDQNCPVFIRYG